MQKTLSIEIRQAAFERIQRQSLELNSAMDSVINKALDALEQQKRMVNPQTMKMER